MVRAYKELSREEILEIASKHEAEGNALMKAGRKVEASDKYILAASIFVQVETGARVREGRNMDRIYSMVK